MRNSNEISAELDAKLRELEACQEDAQRKDLAGDVEKLTRELGDASEESDGAKIRRCATENNITMFTALDTVRVLLDVLEETTLCISTIDA